MRKAIFVFIMLLSINLLAQEKGRLGLLNIKSGNIDKDLLHVIDKGIRQELLNSNRYILILEDEMERMLGLSPVVALENCKSDIMCISQMGEIIKVYWLLSISITKEKGNVIVRGILYNIPNARIDLRLIKGFRMSASLVEEISVYVEEALKKIGTGSINVTAPEDFQVFIDGTFYSNAPVVVDGLATGIHNVRIRKNNTDCLVKEVNVSVSEVTEVQLMECGPDTSQEKSVSTTIKDVSPLSFYEQPSFIVSSSAALMFLSTGIVLGILSRSDEEKVRNAKCDSVADRDSLCQQVNAKELLDSANAKAKAANISFGLAGIATAVATGVGINYYIKNKSININASAYLDGTYINLSFSY